MSRHKYYDYGAILLLLLPSILHSQIVEDRLLTAHGHDACLAADRWGRIHAAWSDSGVSYAILDSNLVPLKTHPMISVVGYGLNSRIAIGAQNVAIILSRRDFNVNMWHIYFQLMDIDGNLIRGIQRLDEPYTLPQRKFPDVTFLNDSTISCVWVGNGLHNLGDVFFVPTSQILDTSGTLIGYNNIVNDDMDRGIAGSSRVSRNPANGDFLVAWRAFDTSNTNQRLYARLCSRAGIPLGPSIPVTDSLVLDTFFFAAGICPSKHYVVASGNKRDSTWRIERLLIGLDGIPQGPPTTVNSGASTIPSESCVDMSVDSSGKYVIVWEQTDGGFSHIFGQRFSPDGTPMGLNFQISTSPYNISHYFPSVALNGSRITTAWQAYNSTTKDFQIWANVRDFEDPELTAAETREDEIVNYNLKVNYPNPFNSSTIIEYDVPASGSVKLGVCNILGQEVRTIVNSVQGRGHYKMLWDGKSNAGADVPTGTYFCRLILQGRAAGIKMLLLR